MGSYQDVEDSCWLLSVASIPLAPASAEYENFKDEEDPEQNLWKFVTQVVFCIVTVLLEGFSKWLTHTVLLQYFV